MTESRRRSATRGTGRRPHHLRHPGRSRSGAEAQTLDPCLGGRRRRDDGDIVARSGDATATGRARAMGRAGGGATCLVVDRIARRERRGMDPGYVVLRYAWTPFRDDEAGGRRPRHLRHPGRNRSEAEAQTRDPCLGGRRRRDVGDMAAVSGTLRRPDARPAMGRSGGGATRRVANRIARRERRERRERRGMDPGYVVLRCARTPFRDDEGGGRRGCGRCDAGRGRRPQPGCVISSGRTMRS
jgi:hypothetical protein